LERSSLERALALARDDMTLIAPAETMFGHIEHASGNLSAARDRFARGIAGFRTLPIPWGVGSALSGMAGAVLATGDVDQAEHLLDEATSLLSNSGPWFLTPVRCFRAVLAVRGSGDCTDEGEPHQHS
jgi:hypothetical protein